MQLEVISRKPEGPARPTPILFVHGAWHAAWCWEEYFMPYFAQHGYTCFALSLRGHGKSENNKALRWTRALEYVEDVEQIARGLDTPPIVIGHSMGGYVVQKYLERNTAPAGVLLAPIPAVRPIVVLFRTMLKHPLAVLKMNLTLSLYPIIETPELSKEAFFSASLPDDQALHYHQRLQDDAYLGMFDYFLLNLPQPAKVKTPLLVLGAANDTLFMRREIEATARVHHTQAVIFPDTAHDMMLEASWQSTADRIISWLSERGL